MTGWFESDPNDDFTIPPLGVTHSREAKDDRSFEVFHSAPCSQNSSASRPYDMMKRTGLAVLVVLALIPLSVSAVDRDFLEAWERAQKGRPERLSSTGTIALRGEPGTPLRIDGQVLTNAGRASVRDAVVFAWQTDAQGIYDRREAGLHSWRLRGWAKTDAEGRFRFKTIRPVAYPNGREPAHVHFTVQRSDGRRYFASDLMFDDDPLITASIRERRRAGIAKVESADGAQSVTIRLELEEKNRF